MSSGTDCLELAYFFPILNIAEFQKNLFRSAFDCTSMIMLFVMSIAPHVQMTAHLTAIQPIFYHLFYKTSQEKFISQF